MRFDDNKRHLKKVRINLLPSRFGCSPFDPNSLLGTSGNCFGSLGALGAVIVSGWHVGKSLSSMVIFFSDVSDATDFERRFNLDSYSLGVLTNFLKFAFHFVLFSDVSDIANRETDFERRFASNDFNLGPVAV